MYVCIYVFIYLSISGSSSVPEHLSPVLGTNRNYSASKDGKKWRSV